MLEKLNIKLPLVNFSSLNFRIYLITSLNTFLSLNIIQLLKYFLKKRTSTKNKYGVNISSFHELTYQPQIFLFIRKISLHITKFLLTYVHQRNGVKCITKRHHLLQVKFRFFIEIQLITRELEKELYVFLRIELRQFFHETLSYGFNIGRYIKFVALDGRKAFALQHFYQFSIIRRFLKFLVLKIAIRFCLRRHKYKLDSQ